MATLKRLTVPDRPPDMRAYAVRVPYGLSAPGVHETIFSSRKLALRACKNFMGNRKLARIYRVDIWWEGNKVAKVFRIYKEITTRWNPGSVPGARRKS